MDYASLGLHPYGAIPTERQMAHIKMEKKAFIHFGVNTFTGNEWGLGDETETLFNPTELDATQWARVIKNAGCKLAIITAKHHDGFCLWPSKYTKHSVKNSPYKNGNGDVVGEFVAACRAEGIKVGIYISPWDRSVKEWGTAEYSNFFANQLTELLTDYGRIDEVWWDGAGSNETEYDWALWTGLVRALQPTAATFGSGGSLDTVDLRWVGNEKGVAGTTHFASLECTTITNYPAAKLNTGTQGGNAYIYSESDVSIRPGWFYHESQDGFVKTPSVLDRIWFTSVGRNSNLLLNFPPDKRGLIHERDAQYAKISNDNISRMRSVDYARGAMVTADTELGPTTSAKNLVDGDSETFYASMLNKRSAVINITLAEPKKINVMILGEVLPLGERINSFKLESVTDIGSELIARGTSVGYLRAVTFKESEYKSLRLTLEGADSIVLSYLSLHRYEAPKIGDLPLPYGENIILKNAHGKIFSNGDKEVILAFGGIFDFNTVEASVKAPCEYELYLFDGTSFQFALKGVSDGEKIKIRLENIESGSYQIKLKATEPFVTDDNFRVSLEK